MSRHGAARPALSGDKQHLNLWVSPHSSPLSLAHTCPAQPSRSSHGRLHPSPRPPHGAAAGASSWLAHRPLGQLPQRPPLERWRQGPVPAALAASRRRCAAQPPASAPSLWSSRRRRRRTASASCRCCCKSSRQMCGTPWRCGGGTPVGGRLGGCCHSSAPMIPPPRLRLPLPSSPQPRHPRRLSCCRARRPSPDPSRSCSRHRCRRLQSRVRATAGARSLACLTAHQISCCRSAPSWASALAAAPWPASL